MITQWYMELSLIMNQVTRKRSSIKMGIFNTKNGDTKSQLENKAFFDSDVTINRYDKVKYQKLESFTRDQISFFWVPEEVDVSKDRIDFGKLEQHEQHIFTSNLKRQIMLDSIQGRGPNLVYLPYVSLPELETWIETWGFSEAVHSRSYSHIIRNVYSDPDKVFDEITSIPEIVDCANDIAKYYDDLDEYGKMYSLFGEGTFTINSDHDRSRTVTISLYELKKKLWLALNATNALEGVRFYASFICSWNFAELKKMEGNAKIIKLICR